jgi:cytochrome oxidase Cu insertion factor (SCO1/SenC/PrrC family)
MQLSRALLQPGSALPVLTAGTLLDPPKPLPPMPAASAPTASTETGTPASQAEAVLVASANAPVPGSPASAAPAAGFIDQDRQAFGLDRLEGRWSLMFFGFTNCPDICPMTLGTLAQAEKQLEDLPQAQRPQVILVSVDARRDTPERLASYVRFFGPSFTGITAPQEIVEDFARQMGVVVAITPIAPSSTQASSTQASATQANETQANETQANETQANETQDSEMQDGQTQPEGESNHGDNYTVDHSASIFLIDPRGTMRALFSPSHTAEAIAADYRRVIAADHRNAR